MIVKGDLQTRKIYSVFVRGWEVPLSHLLTFQDFARISALRRAVSTAMNCEEQDDATSEIGSEDGGDHREQWTSGQDQNSATANHMTRDSAGNWKSTWSRYANASRTRTHKELYDNAGPRRLMKEVLTKLGTTEEVVTVFSSKNKDKKGDESPSAGPQKDAKKT